MRNTIYLTMLIISFSSYLFSQKLEIYDEEGFKYILDKSGKRQKKFYYNTIYWCTNLKNTLLADADNKFLVNLETGRILEFDESDENLKIRYDSCYLEETDYVRIKEDGKIGLISVAGKIILPSSYNAIYPKADKAEFYLLSKGKTWQFYYPDSNKFSVIFSVTDASQLYLDNGFSYLPIDESFIANVGKEIHLMKANGLDFVLDNRYKHSNNFDIFYSTILLAQKNGKLGYIDGTGNIRIPFIFDEADVMEGKAIVKKDGYCGLLNDNNTMAIPLIYNHLKMENADIYLAIRDKKEIRIYENGNPFYEMLPFQDNRKYGFTSEDNSIIIPAYFDSVKSFVNGLAAVKSEGKWGFINPTGHLIIPYRYDETGIFNTYGFAPVKTDKKWGIIENSGELLCRPDYDSIFEFNSGELKLTNRTGEYLFSVDRKLKLLTLTPELNFMVDPRDGKKYKTVKIGNQEWFAQNLAIKSESSLSYENSDLNADSCGRLYKFKEANKACPLGWHLPSDQEWKELEKSLGMPDEELNSMHFTRGAGQAALFRPGGRSAMDMIMTGFFHGYDHNFYKKNEVCIVWTSTPSGSDFAYTRAFFPSSDMINRNDNTFIGYALPVRCVRNTEQ